MRTDILRGERERARLAVAKTFSYFPNMTKIYCTNTPGPVLSLFDLYRGSRPAAATASIINFGFANFFLCPVNI